MNLTNVFVQHSDIVSYF